MIPALAFSLALAAATTTTARPEDAAARTIRPEAIRAHVRLLADDLLEGRGTGTRGYDLAAQYLAGRFEALGLEPAGVDGFFQPVRYRSAVIVPDRSSVRISGPNGDETLTWGTDYYAVGDVREAASTVNAPIVFVRHGIVAPDFGIDDYKGIDVRGKVVAFITGAPNTLPTAERGHYSSTRLKLDEAAARGAVAALHLREAATEQISPFARALRQATQPSMAWLDRDGFPNGRKTDIRIVAVLSEAGSRKLLGGAAPDQAAALPVSLVSRIESTHSDVTSSNVIARLPGSDPKLRDEIVVYTAHVDHLGVGEPVNGDAIYNGATDNAGSVAALIEVARAFASLPKPPRRSLLFIGVAGEEKGLLGSDYFVEYPTVPRERMVANVNMDGTNLLFEFKNVIDIGGDHSTMGSAVTRAAARLGVEVTPDPTPEQMFFIRSDHYSFVRRGIPALFPMIGTKAVDPKLDGAQLRADRYRLRYHLPNDDFNQPLDWNAGAKAARYAFLLGYFTAQGDARPTWNDGDFFGKTFGAKK